MQIVSLGDICLKCQSLFSGKNKKNISECNLLKIIPSMLSITWLWGDVKFFISSSFSKSSKMIFEANCIVVFMYESCWWAFDHLGRIDTYCSGVGDEATLKKIGFSTCLKWGLLPWVCSHDSEKESTAKRKNLVLLHEMSNPSFWEKTENIVNLSLEHSKH